MCLCFSVRHLHDRWIKTAGTKETWKKKKELTQSHTSHIENCQNNKIYWTDSKRNLQRQFSFAVWSTSFRMFCLKSKKSQRSKLLTYFRWCSCWLTKRRSEMLVNLCGFCFSDWLNRLENQQNVRKLIPWGRVFQSVRWKWVQSFVFLWTGICCLKLSCYWIIPRWYYQLGGETDKIICFL